MVMRRYPNGADGASFFMKEAPTPRPPWIRICPIEHGEGKVVQFPVIDDEPSLLWCVNLGCIDLNQWYSRCDDVDRPDYLHFDLDPSEGAGFDLVRKAGLIVRDALTTLGMKPYVKTSGSRGLHVYVPIVRGPLQEDVLTFTKALATELAARNPKVLTVEYRKSAPPARPRAGGLPPERVGADAGEHLLRPPEAAGHGVDAADVGRGRSRAPTSRTSAWTTCASAWTSVGDLWKPILAAKGRTNLGRFFGDRT